MSSTINGICTWYDYLLVELADPRVKSWFLMNSPFPILTIVGFYLYFVLNYGPKWMQNRPAFNLEKILILFNIFQIAANLYLVVQGIRYTVFVYSPFCEPIDYSNTEMAVYIAKHVWFYFILKLTDLLDTVFFVLRKNNRQVSFLHVYHHTGMCLLGWGGTKYLAGGHGVFVGFLNAIVHVAMYSYYLLSAWDKKYKSSLWLKKFITQIQIIQFFILSMYFIQILLQPNCAYPKWTAWIFVPQNIFMVILFVDFYIKAYVKPYKDLPAKKSDSNNISTSNSSHNAKSCPEECDKKTK